MKEDQKIIDQNEHRSSAESSQASSRLDMAIYHLSSQYDDQPQNEVAGITTTAIVLLYFHVFDKNPYYLNDKFNELVLPVIHYLNLHGYEALKEQFRDNALESYINLCTKIRKVIATKPDLFSLEDSEKIEKVLVSIFEALTMQRDFFTVIPSAEQEQ